MTRDKFYRDTICCEVARVYCRNVPDLKQEGWAISPTTGAPHFSDLSRAQCDHFIDKMHKGDVKAAHETAYDYLSGGCGIAG